MNESINNKIKIMERGLSLKRARAKLKLERHQVAFLINIDESYIYDIEYGDVDDLFMCKRLDSLYKKLQERAE